MIVSMTLPLTAIVDPSVRVASVIGKEAFESLILGNLGYNNESGRISKREKEKGKEREREMMMTLIFAALLQRRRKLVR